LGVRGDIYIYDGLAHDMNAEELIQLEKWMCSIFC
jgi:hypothetical protein